MLRFPAVKSNKFHIMFITSQIELLKAFKVILFWYFIFQKTPTSSMLKSNNPLNYYEIIEVYSIVSLFMYHLQRMWKELFPKAVWLHHSQILSAGIIECPLLVNWNSQKTSNKNKFASNSEGKRSQIYIFSFLMYLFQLWLLS